MKTAPVLPPVLRPPHRHLNNFFIAYTKAINEAYQSGAVLSALHLSGFDAQEIRRSWAALRYGHWEANELLESWQVYVASQNQWRARRFERYHVLSVDITGFWRPHLQGWVGRHYHHLAQKTLPAVVVGVMIISGQVGARRIPLLRRIVRCQPQTSKPDFRRQLLQEVAAQMALDQMRSVQSFSPQQGAHRSSLRTAVRLVQDALLVLCTILPAFRLRFDFWVGQAHGGPVSVEHRSLLFVILP